MDGSTGAGPASLASPPPAMDDDPIVDRFMDATGTNVLTVRRRTVSLRRAPSSILSSVANAVSGNGILSLPFKGPEGGIIGASISHRNSRKLLVHSLVETAVSKGDKRSELITYQEKVEPVIMATDQDALEAQSLIRLIATACPREPDRSKRILVVLNPHGGRGAQAKDYTYGIVGRLLAVAGIAMHAVESQYAGHAVDIGRTYDPGTYEGVALVGGDGTAWEFVTGLLSRPDWSALCRRVPILMIKCGTNNAVAMGVRTTLPHYGTYCAIKRLLRPLDAMLVVNAAGVRAISLCVAAYGVASTVALESEATRSSFGLWRYEFLKTRGAYRVAAGKTRYTGALESSGDIALTDDELALYSASYPPYGGCAVTGSYDAEAGLAPDCESVRQESEAGATDAEAGAQLGPWSSPAGSSASNDDFYALTAMNQLVPAGSVPASIRVLKALRTGVVPGALPQPPPKEKVLKLYPCFLSQFSRRPIAKALDKLRNTYVPCSLDNASLSSSSIIDWPQDTVFGINSAVRDHDNHDGDEGTGAAQRGISNSKSSSAAVSTKTAQTPCRPPTTINQVGLVNLIAPTAAVVEAVLDLQKEAEEEEERRKQDSDDVRSGGSRARAASSTTNNDNKLVQALCGNSSAALGSIDESATGPAFAPPSVRSGTAARTPHSGGTPVASFATPRGQHPPDDSHHPHVRSGSAREVLSRHVIPHQHRHRAASKNSHGGGLAGLHLGGHEKARRHAAFQSATLEDLRELESAEPSGRAPALLAHDLYRVASLAGATSVDVAERNPAAVEQALTMMEQEVEEKEEELTEESAAGVIGLRERGTPSASRSALPPVTAVLAQEDEAPPSMSVSQRVVSSLGSASEALLTGLLAGTVPVAEPGADAISNDGKLYHPSDGSAPSASDSLLSYTADTDEASAMAAGRRSPSASSSSGSSRLRSATETHPACRSDGSGVRSSVTCKLRDAFTEEPSVTAAVARRTWERDADVVTVNENELFTPQMLPQSFLDRYGLDVSSLQGIGIGGVLGFGRSGGWGSVAGAARRRGQRASRDLEVQQEAQRTESPGLTIAAPPAKPKDDDEGEEGFTGAPGTRVYKRQRTCGSIHSPSIDPSCGRPQHHRKVSSMGGDAVPAVGLVGVSSGALIPPVEQVLQQMPYPSSSDADTLLVPHRRGAGTRAAADGLRLPSSKRSMSSFASCKSGKSSVGVAEPPGVRPIEMTPAAQVQQQTTQPVVILEPSPLNEEAPAPMVKKNGHEGFDTPVMPFLGESGEESPQTAVFAQHRASVATGQPLQPSQLRAKTEQTPVASRRPSVELQSFQPLPDAQVPVDINALTEGTIEKAGTTMGPISASAASAVSLVRTPPVVCATPDGADARRPSALCADEVVAGPLLVGSFCSPFWPRRGAGTGPNAANEQSSRQATGDAPQLLAGPATAPGMILPSPPGLPLTFVSPAARLLAGASTSSSSSIPQVSSIPSIFSATPNQGDGSLSAAHHYPHPSAATRSEIADCDALSIGGSTGRSARSDDGNYQHVIHGPPASDTAALSSREGSQPGMPLSAPAAPASGSPVAVGMRVPSGSSAVPIRSPPERAGSGTEGAATLQARRTIGAGAGNVKEGRRRSPLAAAPRTSSGTGPTPSAVAAALLLPKILWPNGGYGPLNPQCERNCKVCKARGRLRFVGSRPCKLKLDLSTGSSGHEAAHAGSGFLGVPEGEGLVSQVAVNSSTATVAAATEDRPMMAPIVRGDSSGSSTPSAEETTSTGGHQAAASASLPPIGHIPCPSASPSGVSLAPPLPTEKETEDVLSRVLRQQAQVRTLADKAAVLNLASSARGTAQTPSDSPASNAGNGRSPAVGSTASSHSSTNGGGAMGLLRSIFGGKKARTESAPLIASGPFDSEHQPQGDGDEDGSEGYSGALAPLASTSSATSAPASSFQARSGERPPILDPRVAVGPGSAMAAVSNPKADVIAYSVPVGISVSGRGYLKKKERGSYLTIACISLAAEAPSHHPSDGFTDLLVIRTGSKRAIFNVLTSYAIKGLPSIYNKTALVEYAKVRSCVITPDPKQEDVVLCVDGEVFPSPGPYIIHVLPSLLTVYGEW